MEKSLGGSLGGRHGSKNRNREEKEGGSYYHFHYYKLSYKRHDRAKGTRNEEWKKAKRKPGKMRK